MGRTNKAIIISGFFVAFLAGIIVAAPQASAANPVLTFLQDTVVPLLNDILAAINDIDTDLDPGTQAQIDDIQQSVDNIESLLVSTTDADGDGFTPNEGDCNDSDVAINPSATEVCDSVDNNCDGFVDEGGICEDADGDGVIADLDCDDNDANNYPGNTEVCDLADNDCDTVVDEGVTTTYYEDADGDGYGNPSAPVEACVQPGSFVENDLDCDDTDAQISPDADELLGDGADNNCDGTADPVDIFGTWSLSPVLVSDCTATVFGLPVDGQISMEELSFTPVGSDIRISAIFDIDFIAVPLPDQELELITTPFITHPSYDVSAPGFSLEGLFTSNTTFEAVVIVPEFSEDFGTVELECDGTANVPIATIATKN